MHGETHPDNALMPDAVHGQLDRQVRRLPADVARCAGYLAEAELREGCEDCLRRTSGHTPGNRTLWMSPPPLVVFECEARIAP
jgi:hypothetical protein